MKRLTLLPLLLLLAGFTLAVGCAKPLPPPAPPAEPRDKDGYTVHERAIADSAANWQRGQDLHVLRARRNALRQREGHSHAEQVLSDIVSDLEAPGG